MRTDLYELKDSQSAKRDAQRNLEGRTHYVDDDTLRYHKARIISTHVLFEGFLFGLIENIALDPRGQKRGARYVIFDVMGRMISRVNLEDAWRTRNAATKAMWARVEELDPVAITNIAIEVQEGYIAGQISDLRHKMEKLKPKKATP